MKQIEIGKFVVGDNCPVFIVAELSANHNHQKKIAIDTIKAARKAGADAIKLQTYTPDTITINCDNDYFKINKGTLWDGKTLYELYQEAFTPWEWHEELFHVAKEEGLICFSTPFDPSAVDLLEQLEQPAYKIASFEITDIPLIELVASKGKPVIISTGIAEKKDIAEAVEACKRQNNEQVILLKCTSAYPAPLEEINLRTIPDIRKNFDTLVGLSDHSLGTTIPVAAVSLGACLIEKHFILDKKLGGVDAAFSLDPSEFKAMSESIRNIEKALGTVQYEVSEKVKKNRIFARSLFVVEDIKKGEELSKHNIRSIRPGYGLHPKFYYQVLGKKANKDLKRGTPLKDNMINW